MCLYLLNGGGGGGTLARFLRSGILKNLMARFDNNNNNQILKHIVASCEKKFAQCLGAGVACGSSQEKGLQEQQ